MDFDPFAPDVRCNPYPYFAQLRNYSPVYWMESLQSWAITRYEDVAYVAKNTQIFSSAPIIPAILGELNPVPEVNWLISTDPPAHQPLRKLVNKAFTPRMVAALEPRIREIAAQLLDRVEPGGDFDFVRDFATPLPMMVIAEMLGVDAQRHRDFKHWSDDMLRLTGGAVPPGELPLLRQSVDDMRSHFEQVIDERRGQPKDDLITALVRAEDENHALTGREVLAMCVLLLIAGNETTTNLLGNTAFTLLSHPAALARVRANPALVPQMIEEILRYESPVQAIFRLTTCDARIAGRAIPAASRVLIFYGSANRDERQFANPDTFDLERNPQDHLAFGFGIHYCLGAPLARLEAKVAVDAFLRRLPQAHLREPRAQWVDSFVVRGPKTLPLAIGPA
ncbi:MAG TPA: cytochrome P450 [Candidatus Binataceae bacterium]|nr:cytochrome P450 [Candidatus Binataceae bacterium]